MKKINSHFFLITVIFIAVIYLLCSKYIDGIFTYKQLFVIIFVTILYCIVLIEGFYYLKKRRNLEKSRPLEICFGDSRTIFIFKVKRNKIGFVEYEPGISLSNFKVHNDVYNPEYVNIDEIPEDFRIIGIRVKITRVKKYNNDGHYFEFKRVCED